MPGCGQDSWDPSIRTTKSSSYTRWTCVSRAGASTGPSHANTAAGSSTRGPYTYDYQEGCDFEAIAARSGRGSGDVQDALAAAGMCLEPLGDVNGDGRIDQVGGNIIRVQHPSVLLLPDSLQAAAEGDTQQVVVELRAYNRFGQLVKAVDPLGNEDLYTYYPERDPDGDGQGPIPGASEDPLGYLKQVVHDAVAGPEDVNEDSRVNLLDLATGASDLGSDAPRSDVDGDGTVGPQDLELILGSFGKSSSALTTVYLYDAVGNVIRQVDGRGVATDYAVNQLNQVVQVTRAAETGVFPADPPEPDLVEFQYIERFFYDANDNQVLAQREDRGNTSGVDGNPPETDLPPGILDPDPLDGSAFVETGHKYDILDRQVEQVREVSNGASPEFLRTGYRYDPNENLVLVIQPEGNASSMVYDERDLLFQSTRGALAPPLLVLLGEGDVLDYDVRGGIPSTTTFHYDRNRNLEEIVDADDTDGSPDNNSLRGGLGDRTRSVYDGFNRRTSAVDSLGNQEVFQYDPAGNVVRVTRFGPVGGLSPTQDGPDPLPRPVSFLGEIQTPNLMNSNPMEATETLYDELTRTTPRPTSNLTDWTGKSP